MKNNLTLFKNKQSGQGTVEMIATLVAFFTVAFLFVQMALSFAAANYIQYATYISARALQSARSTEAAQKQAAINVFLRTLKPEDKDIFGNLVKPVDIGSDIPGAQIGRNSRAELGSSKARSMSWLQGVTYQFQSKLYMIPSLPFAKAANKRKLVLTSESWLGREPSTEECIKSLQQYRAKISTLVTDPLFDNGC